MRPRDLRPFCLSRKAHPRKPARSPLTPVRSKPEEVTVKLKRESLEMAKLVKDIGYQPQ